MWLYGLLGCVSPAALKIAFRDWPADYLLDSLAKVVPPATRCLVGLAWRWSECLYLG